jgi:hypothetical protein
VTLYNPLLYKKYDNIEKLYNGLKEMEVDVILLEERKILWSHFDIIVKDKEGFEILRNQSDYGYSEPPYPAYRIKNKFKGKIDLHKIKQRVFMSEIMKFGKMQNHFSSDMDYYLNYHCNTKIKVNEVKMFDSRGRKMNFTY